MVVEIAVWTYYFFLFFFFNDTATTEIYTLSLHDALPIYIDVQVVNTIIIPMKVSPIPSHYAYYIRRNSGKNGNLNAYLLRQVWCT